MENTDLLALISRLEGLANQLNVPYGMKVSSTTIKTLCAELRQRIEREQKDTTP